MALKRLSIAGVLAVRSSGCPLTAARADEPMTAEEAEAAAKAARKTGPTTTASSAASDTRPAWSSLPRRGGAIRGHGAEAGADTCRDRTSRQRVARTDDRHLQLRGGLQCSAVGRCGGVKQIDAQNKAQVEAQGSGQTPNPTCENIKPVTDFLCKEYRKDQQ